MTDVVGATPAGTRPTAGIVSALSPYPVSEAVDRLSSAIREAGATLFAVIDHSGAAARAGLALRDTKLLIFGAPVGGTPVMVAAPLAALDLPLKVLVWEDDDAVVWMSTLDPAWLTTRYGLAAELSAPLSAAVKLVGGVAGSR